MLQHPLMQARSANWFISSSMSAAISLLLASNGGNLMVAGLPFMTDDGNGQTMIFQVL